MRNHTATARALQASCALAIALLIIVGVGVNSTWAGSDRPSGLNYTPIWSGGVFPPVPSTGHHARSITMPRIAEQCITKHNPCNPERPQDCCTNHCGGVTLLGVSESRCECPPNQPDCTEP
jgi:hypothetical protein